MDNYTEKCRMSNPFLPNEPNHVYFLLFFLLSLIFRVYIFPYSCYLYSTRCGIHFHSSFLRFISCCILSSCVTKFFDRSNRIANEVRTDLNWIINYYPFYCVLDGSLYDAIGVYLLLLFLYSWWKWENW